MTPTPTVEAESRELLPCPFCGAKAKVEERHNPMSKWRFSAECVSTTCGMSGPVEATSANARAAWNRRADLRAALHPEPERTDEVIQEAFAYLSKVEMVDGQIPEAAALIDRLRSRLDRIRQHLARRAPPTPIGGGEPTLRAALTKLARAVTTMGRESVSAADQGEAVARECRPIFESVGMSNEGDGWGFADGDDDTFGAAEREVGRYIYKRVEALMSADPDSPAERELSYLADIVSDVEEYGADTMDPSDIRPSEHFALPSPATGGVETGEPVAEAWERLAASATSPDPRKVVGPFTFSPEQSGHIKALVDGQKRDALRVAVLAALHRWLEWDFSTAGLQYKDGADHIIEAINTVVDGLALASPPPAAGPTLLQINAAFDALFEKSLDVGRDAIIRDCRNAVAALFNGAGR